MLKKLKQQYKNKDFNKDFSNKDFNNSKTMIHRPCDIYEPNKII